MLPVLSPPVPLWAAVLLVNSFVSALPVEARLTQLVPLLARTFNCSWLRSYAARSSRFSSSVWVILTVTWICSFHFAPLMFCTSSLSSSSVPSSSLPWGTTTPSCRKKCRCQRTTSSSWTLSSSCLSLTSSKTVSPNRVVGWHLLRFLLLAQFSSLTGPGCDTKDCGPHPCRCPPQVGLEIIPLVPVISAVGSSSPTCNAPKAP